MRYRQRRVVVFGDGEKSTGMARTASGGSSTTARRARKRMWRTVGGKLGIGGKNNEDSNRAGGESEKEKGVQGV